MQYVKLHGELPGSPNGITFSVRQYARRMAEHDVWYDHFVRDYALRTTLLMGTDLNEPIFWRYVESREKRSPRGMDHRPDSFLVTPVISPAKVDILKDLNVKTVPVDTGTFLKWLESETRTFADRTEVLKRIQPNLTTVLAGQQGVPLRDQRRLERFFECFESVKVSPANHDHRKMFFYGSSPTWQDIAHSFDAPREVNDRLFAEIDSASANGTEVIALTGTAGCGKSTIAKRVAVRLAAAGRPVFFTNSEDVPKPADVAAIVNLLPNRCAIVLDGADALLDWVAQLVALTKQAANRPLIVVVARTNRFDRACGSLMRSASVREVAVANLSPRDIDAVITVLERHGALGRLQGLTPIQRQQEFERRAQKQLLVAMREATEGKGFDEIIQSEYADLVEYEHRIIYLSACLATAAVYRIETAQLLACAAVSAPDALEIINRSLKGLLNADPVGSTWLRARHSMIAEYLVDTVANREELKQAYIRLLAALANDMGRPPDKRSRTFKFYRRLINHVGIFRRFAGSLSSARDIYESLRRTLSADPHFWLQYGSLELEHGELDPATNYIAQAESLAPHDDLILTTRGHLLLKKVGTAATELEATQYWDEGRAVLENQLLQRGARDAHPFHILGSQAITYSKRLSDKQRRRDVLQYAKETVEKGLANHQRSRELIQLFSDLTKERIQLGSS